MSNKTQPTPEQGDDSVPLIKKYIVHATFLSLMVGIAWQGQEAAVADRDSLLYSVIAGEEVAEGPLDPNAYAGTDTPGVGGARLSALNADLGIELITFDDPEVSFASTLGGNAVIAPLSPIAPEPGSDTTSSQSDKPKVYTVQDGDTIASIAAQFNISTNTVLWANGLSDKDIIKIGDHLTILPTTGVFHTVASGDTVLALAQKYDADAEDIIAYNKLNDDAKLAIGQKVIIPDGYIAPRAASPIISDTDIAFGSPPPPSSAKSASLIWPTTTKHISQYFRWGHTGVDIDNRARPPIYAAATGVVEFSGRLGGYGKLIIVNHGSGLVTYYSHNEANYVKKGDTVTQGQAIAKVGSTGRSSGAHLHFEVRKYGRPINPLSMY